MAAITNKGDVPLGLAVWLVHDEYDYINEPNYISVTGLMKPIKQIVLPPRVPKELREADVEDFVSRAMGHSLHDSIEKAWVKGYDKNLKKLGYPQKVIDRVIINPTDAQLSAAEEPIPIYLEQRAFMKFSIDGEEFTIGGKYDMVAEGILHDNKSTTAYTWLYGTRDDEHQLQGSLYRLINPDKITEDFIRINYIFTDWSKASAKQNPKYPQSRVLYKDIPLMSVEDTKAWVNAKLREFKKYRNAPEEKLPDCTDEELWRSETSYKYYSDPTKTSGKSSKNFTDMVEARKHHASKGKGVIIVFPGEVKRCLYCPAFPICKQKDRYFS